MNRFDRRTFILSDCPGWRHHPVRPRSGQDRSRQEAGAGTPQRRQAALNATAASA